jgi:hypothetical protein
MADNVIIDLDGTPVSVSLADAAEMRDALIRALSQSPRADFRDLVQTVAGSEPAITPQGSLRIGMWRLGARAGRLALMCHLYTNDAASVGCLAFVDKVKDHWEVLQVTDDIMRFD